VKTSASGTHVFEASEVRLARLLLQRTHWKGAVSTTTRHQKDSTPILVRMPKDLLALDVQLSLPNRSTPVSQRSGPECCVDELCGFCQLNSVNRRLFWLLCQLDEITSRASLSGFHRLALPFGLRMHTCIEVSEKFRKCL
jgi:hypothetical protein